MTDVGASYLILHGLANHRPPDHWQFWLAGKLAELHHQVLYPSLPEADEPSVHAWTQALHDGLRELSRDGTRVVICHSLACLLWMRTAPSIAPDDRPDRLLLVAPPAANRLPPAGTAFAIDALDGDAVRASACAEIHVVGSDNDPYNPPDARQDYAAALGLSTMIVPGAGHITPDDGYGTWPFVLDWALGR